MRDLTPLEDAPESVSTDARISNRGAAAQLDRDNPTCLERVFDATPSPLDLVMQLDSSFSMLDTSGQGAALVSKWVAVQRAVQGFLTDPVNAEVGIGLSYFPRLVPDVPASCISNADCGAAAPCSNSICVEPRTISVEGGPAGTWLQQSPSSPANCLVDRDCPIGASCRALNSVCSLPSGIVNLNADTTGVAIPALCGDPADCPGALCESAGQCLDDAQRSCTTINAPCAGDTCLLRGGSCLNETLCGASDYSVPAVPIVSAASGMSMLLDSLATRAPEGRTPTGPALQGALEYAALWARQHVERQVAVILVTDGFPTHCAPLEATQLAELISRARTATPTPLELYVTGIFGGTDLESSPAFLDALARAGGSAAAYLADTAGDVPRSLLNALQQSRVEAGRCGYLLDAAVRQDADTLTAELSDPGGPTQPLHRVASAAACDSNGWYYVHDASGAPVRLQVCPGSCPPPFGPARVRLRLACE